MPNSIHRPHPSMRDRLLLFNVSVLLGPAAVAILSPLPSARPPSVAVLVVSLSFFFVVSNTNRSWCFDYVVPATTGVVAWCGVTWCGMAGPLWIFPWLDFVVNLETRTLSHVNVPTCLRFSFERASDGTHLLLLLLLLLLRSMCCIIRL